MNISERIYNLMQEQGKMQQSLSDLLGVPTTTVSYWFRNREKGNFPVEHLVPTADWLGVSVNYLLTGIPDPEQKPTPEPQLLEDEAELLRIYRQLDREGKTMTLATAYNHRSRIIGQGSEETTA